MSDDFENLYYSAELPTAYSGAHKILKKTQKKYQREKCIDWLESQDAFNKHRLVRRRFPRRCYDISNIDDLWECDLIDFRSLRTYNSGTTYLLVVIDGLSKYAWIEPLRDKTSKSVTDGFDRIMSKSNGRRPIILRSDKGREFTGRDFQNFLKKKKIMFRVARSPDVKASLAERLIRTIKEKIWRYFTHQRTRRYIDVLQQILESYNHSVHSATKMTPASVTLENAALARANIREKYSKKDIKRPKYNIGDLVRVSRCKGVFDKGYESGYTEEIFKIIRISCARMPPVYFLTDLDNEEIDGFFYEEELSRVKKNLDKDVFEIDKILRTVGKGSKKKHLVCWKGYPKKFNSWVLASEIKNLQ